jgi:transcriptional regulator with XRE-family HTH domain
VDELLPGNPQLATLIGQRLRDVRRARGWSQQALAEGLFSKGYVSSIEHGKIFPSVRALRALAGRLGVDMSEFFDPALLGGIEAVEAAEDDEEAQRQRLLLLEVRALAAAEQPGMAARLRLLEAERLSPAEQVDLHVAAGQAALAAGDAEGALAAFEQALATLPGVASDESDGARSLPVHLALGEALLARGQATLAVEHFAQVQQLVQDSPAPDPALRRAAVFGLARAYAAAGDVPRARAAFQEALTLAGESASLELLVGQLLGLSRQAATAGQWDAATRYGDQALLLAQTIQTLRAVVQTHLHAGALLRTLGDRAAREVIEQAARLAQQSGTEAVIAEVEAERTALEIEAGALAAAEAALTRAGHAADRAADRRMQARVQYLRARLDQAAGDLAAAETGLRTVLDGLTEPGDRPLRADAAFHLAQVLVAAGRHVAAAPYYEEAFRTRTGAAYPAPDHLSL